MPLDLNEPLSGLKPSGIRRFAALARETEGCISLTLGEPGEDTPQEICAEVARALADGETNVLFGGRLGQYSYFDMDQVVDQALRAADMELGTDG